MRIPLFSLITRTWLIVAISLLLLSPAYGGSRIDITPQQAMDLIQTKHPFLLDVRTRGEFSRGAIKGAYLAPISRFREHEKKIPSDQPILVYCAVGGRSRPVADYLARQGLEVYNLKDGIVEWAREGFPVQK